MRFSVVIAVYNGAQHVGQAIDSVLAQTFTDFELFVVNDGSTDDTARVLSSYGAAIRVLEQPNAGPEVARNKAVSQASGEYLAFLDHDDLFFPNALQIYDEVLRSHNSPPLLMASRVVFEDDQAVPRLANSPVKVSIYRDFLQRDMYMGTSMSLIVMRRSTFSQTGAAANCTPSSWHLNDFHLLLKASTSGPFIVIREPITVAYRSHAGNCHRNQGAMVDAVLSLIDLEQKGQFPGGKERKKERYLWIGSVTWHRIRLLLSSSNLKWAGLLFLRGSPMLSVALPQKARIRISKKFKSLTAHD